MKNKRKVQVFSAGCPVCDKTVQMVNRLACSSCEVEVMDMHDPDVAAQAEILSISSVPAVVIDGKPAYCCAGCGPDEARLRAAGVGQPKTGF